MITEFIETQALQRGLSVHTLRAYESDLRGFASWAKVHTAGRWSQITQTDVESYVKELATAGSQPATIARKISALRTYYRHQLRHHRMANNPAQYVSTPKQAELLPRALGTDAVSSTIADTSINTETRLLVALMAETGARVGEALALTRDAIDRERRTIRLTGKGAKERVVRYGSKTDTLLTAVGAYDKHGHVFASCNEREYRYRVYVALGRHTDSPLHSPHSLRHTFAVAHLEAGTELTILSQMLGHTSLKATNRYAQVAGARLLQSFNNIKL